ncbi:MAG: MotA/TolQ/ExbB proton channel family protein, partial [Sphingobacteriales bacterium]
MADVKTATAARPSGTPRAAGKPKNSNSFWINLVIVLACVGIGQAIFHVVLGDKSHFEGGDYHKPIDWMGNMHSGGPIVPLLMAMFMIMLAFVIERAITILKAKGKTNGGEFVRKVQYHLANKNVDAALAECDKQSGSVGNVMKAGLHAYKEMITNTE